jgi:hypothetical protein
MSQVIDTPGGRIELNVREFEGREWVSFAAYEELQGQLNVLNEDLKQLRKNGAVLDSELAENRRINQDNITMKKDADKIAIFIRENYAREVSLGQHTAFGSLADCVIYYMGRERNTLGKRLFRLFSKRPEQK